MGSVWDCCPLTSVGANSINREEFSTVREKKKRVAWALYSALPTLPPAWLFNLPRLPALPSSPCLLAWLSRAVVSCCSAESDVGGVSCGAAFCARATCYARQASLSPAAWPTPPTCSPDMPSGLDPVGSVPAPSILKDRARQLGYRSSNQLQPVFSSSPTRQTQQLSIGLGPISTHSIRQQI